MRSATYTTSVNLKTAAFLALIGMLLLTVLETVTFFNDLTAYGHDAIAVMALLGAAIRLFASLTVTVFFFSFYRAQA